MPKVTAKVKWNGPTVTLRVSGSWNEVIMSLHEAAMRIRDQAMAKGLVKMNRPRLAAQKFWADPAAVIGVDPPEFDDDPTDV